MVVDKACSMLLAMAMEWDSNSSMVIIPGVNLAIITMEVVMVAVRMLIQDPTLLVAIGLMKDSKHPVVVQQCSMGKLTPSHHMHLLVGVAMVLVLKDIQTREPIMPTIVISNSSMKRRELKCMRL